MNRKRWRFHIWLAYSTDETLSNDTRVNDLDRDLYTKNSKFWTLLPPKAFVFHKHTRFYWTSVHNPVIIERTIGLVLGPSTALDSSFLKHCTLTNKVLGTIWRNLSKPPQRIQGPDPFPSDCKSGLLQPLDLSSLLDGRSIAYSGGCLYIFLIYCKRKNFRVVVIFTFFLAFVFEKITLTQK